MSLGNGDRQGNKAQNPLFRWALVGSKNPIVATSGVSEKQFSETHKSLPRKWIFCLPELNTLS